MSYSSVLDIFTGAASEAGNWLCKLQLVNCNRREFGDDKARC